MNENRSNTTEPFTSLIETLEILREAVDAHNQDEASEAVTVFLMQFMEAFGHDVKIFRATYPILEQLRNHIASRRFEEASPIVLAFLAKFRSAGRLPPP